MNLKFNIIIHVAFAGATLKRQDKKSGQEKL